VAFQLIGDRLEEAKIIRAAHVFEQGRGELAHPRD
jgi:Asp-tRNA(Asn)/Glu-tRNA(Gln) amidotransferase A subunit family amidase